MTMETRQEADVSYGFGAIAPEAQVAMKRRQTNVLSLFVLALSTAVVTLMIVLLPVNSAAATPLAIQSAHQTPELGLAAVAAFGFSTAMCAALLMAPALLSRRRNHRR
jgi:hypothetical protein